MNCLDIIIKYLKDNGYDGLYNDTECGCELKDLVPCCEDFSMCFPGYKVEAPEDSERYWYICESKDSKPWEYEE